MYCVIFAWPGWPCFFSCSNRGMTTVSSWTMIEAVMYGMMPNAKMLSLRSAPPENRFSTVFSELSEPEAQALTIL